MTTGTLSTLPLEIRENIYASLLNFNAPFVPEPQSRRLVQSLHSLDQRDSSLEDGYRGQVLRL
jgi:hypothetical protein